MLQIQTLKVNNNSENVFNEKERDSKKESDKDERDSENESDEEETDSEKKLDEDENGKDDKSDCDSEHEDDHENVALRTFIKGDEIYMKCKSIKFLNGDMVEVDGKILDRSCIVQWEDEDYYYIIGVVLRYHG